MTPIDIIECQVRCYKCHEMKARKIETENFTTTGKTFKQGQNIKLFIEYISDENKLGGDVDFVLEKSRCYRCDQSLEVSFIIDRYVILSALPTNKLY